MTSFSFSFNAVTGRALTRALESLSMSTSLTVSVGGVDWRADRLNSAYLTHQTVSVAARTEPLPPRAVLLDNGHYTVVAGPRAGLDLPPAPAGMAWHEAVIPAHAVHGVAGRVAALVPGLAAQVRALLADLGGTPLVTIAVLLREVVAWEGRRPVFAELAAEDAASELAGIQEASSPDDEPPGDDWPVSLIAAVKH